MNDQINAQMQAPGATWVHWVSAFVVGAVLTGVTLVQIRPDTDDAAAVSAGGSGVVGVDGGFVDGGVDGGTGSSGSAGGTGSGGSGGSVGGASTGAGGSSAGSGAGGSGGLTVGGGGGLTGKGPAGSDPTKGGSLECKPGKNGGETDKGVSANTIKLAANVVTDGPGSNFLADSPIGMEAVVRRINNQENGICGRKLDLRTVNDSWDANRGLSNIRDFVNQGYFALPVVPSSEGLSSAIQAGVIRDAKIPVVGTDGMRKEQYDARGKAAWVWPVATATVAQVRIMADYAYDRLNARTFGIVYDRRYKFGEEGADAFEQYIESKLSGATLKSRQPVEPGKQSYKTEADAFKAKCNPCDVVVLLLEPQTGIAWWTSAGNGGKGSKMTAGAQPLFNDKFARGCGEVCAGIYVWTGYNPAISPNTNKADIARYIRDIRAINPSVDETNQFLQGAYLGMEVFVAAVKKCSPNLTRDCVKAAMDSMNYQSDFSSPLRWAAGNHFANNGARAYSISYAQSTFSGFQDRQTGFVTDPTPGVVPG